jgi:hypothetical protein
LNHCPTGRGEAEGQGEEEHQEAEGGMMTTAETIAALVAEDRKLAGQIREMQDRRNYISADLKRLRLVELVGVPNGVQWEAAGQSIKYGTPGTVLKVNRKKAVVEIDGKKWSVPFWMVKPAAGVGEVVN